MPRPRRFTPRLALLGSLLFLNVLSISLAFTQEAPPAGSIPPEALGPLLRAAADSSGATLAPWQRDYMRELAASGTRTSMTLAPNASDGNWLPLPGGGTGLQGPGRFYHAAIYDPVDDRMILFGGWDGTYRNDVWQLTLSGNPAWTQLSPLGTPPSGRYAFSAIFDPIRRRLIVFGGFDGSARNDTWALSLTGTPAWSSLSTAGTMPGPRLGHTAVYDPVRDRMLIFGGSNNVIFGDTWALPLSGTAAWSPLPGSGPPRTFPSTIYDPVRDRLILFGGYNGSAYVNDTWTLPLGVSANWSSLVASGAPPSIRLAHTAIYDPVRDRMVVFGGYGGAFLNDTWLLSLGGAPSWTQVPASGPSVRDLHSAIYDPLRDRMLIYGGNDATQYINELWSLGLGSGTLTWNSLSPLFPTGRVLPTAIYDSPRNRMVMFGGYGAGSSNEVWSLSLDATLQWNLLLPSGTPPLGRRGHSAFYDPVRDRMVIFGGRGDVFEHFNDVWALSLSGTPSWTQLFTTGSPPSARYLQTAIYDPVRDRMVMFGGDDGGYRGDTWALTLTGTPQWTLLIAENASLVGPHYLHSMIYDPVRDRALMFGGYDGVHYRNDTWELSLGASPAWSPVNVTGAQPGVRLAQTAIYDSHLDRMVVFGGGTGSAFYDDTWALSLGGVPLWSQLAPAGPLPGPREEHSAIYEPNGNRMVIFGGESGPIYGDGFILELGSGPPPPPPTAEVRFQFSPNTLNLKSHGLWVSATLQPKAPLTADQIDVSSIRLNGSVSVDPAANVSLADHDGDGIVDLKVKLDRASVEQTVGQGDHEPMRITGMVNGTPFDETLYIRVLRAVVSAPAGDSHLAGGAVTQVHWESAIVDSAQAAADTLGSAAADSIVSVALLYSVNDGASWDLIASGQPNSGSFDWMVPAITCDQAKVAVVLVHSADSTGDAVEGFLGTSETFSIQSLVGAGPPAPSRTLLWAMPNPSLDGRLRVQFALRSADPARLELLDLGGRVLAAESVGRLGPGAHSLELSRGAPLPSGVYFLRLTQGGDEVRARVAVLR